MSNYKIKVENYREKTVYTMSLNNCRKTTAIDRAFWLIDSLDWIPTDCIISLDKID